MKSNWIYYTSKVDGLDNQAFIQHLEHMHNSGKWELVSASHVLGPGPYEWWHCVFRKEDSP